MEIEDLKVGYDGKAVLGGVSLEVRSGEILALIGPTGCGKSTVLHAVFGLARAQAGRIWFEATEIIRSLVDEVVLTPENGDLRIDLKGDLAAILAISAGKKNPETFSLGTEQIKMVAGTRTHLYRTVLVWFSRRNFG